MTPGTPSVEVALDAHAALGEGPVWDDASGTLIWVDILGQAVHRFDPASGRDRVADVGQPVGAAALRNDGRGLVLALRDGFALLDEASGQVELVAPIEADVPTNRMNDGKCDPLGRFWAGTMAFAETPGVGALYRLDPDLQAHRMLSGVTVSNGLDWTADRRQMYYIDSPTRGIDVFDFDLRLGTLGERRRFITIPPEAGVPDGLTLDADGAIWVALHRGASVARYTPDGDLDQIIRLPTSMVTSCTFGGPDLGDLYITSMTFGMSDEERRAQPLAGALFRCRPGVRGLPARRFAG
jgi:sugar lactone lactonase YvrE